MTTYYNGLQFAPLNDILSMASSIRDTHWGRTITYSRKIFVPLTNMCRDTCSYCTFVKHPSNPAAGIMTPDQVLKEAERGQEKGCKELLFSLGEKPELRYVEAKNALESLGYKYMTDYLADMCELIISETSLLPHVNAGTLSDYEIDKLKPFSASMGMMLETISKRLGKKGMPHFACPDKSPLLRIRTLRRAGEKKVPFTTGLLIGIGETWQERIEALQMINSLNREYGHIQEVIIQNFQRKPGIGMEKHSEPTLEDMLRTIAVARIILDPEISLQAPPNLHQRHIDYLGAGINDWGGISPVTIDFINPQHDWPEIRKLKENCAKAEFDLKERLTIYPRFIKQSQTYLDSNLVKTISAMSRSDGLAFEQTLEAVV